MFKLLVAALSNALAYGPYGAAEDANSNRKLHHIKSHQQLSNTGHIDNNRPQIEEMPYQVGALYTFLNIFYYFVKEILQEYNYLNYHIITIVNNVFIFNELDDVSKDWRTFSNKLLYFNKYNVNYHYASIRHCTFFTVLNYIKLPYKFGQ